jgi:hypothetical protein
MPVTIRLNVSRAQRQVNAAILLLYEHLGRHQKLLTAVQPDSYLRWIIRGGWEQSPV